MPFSTFENEYRKNQHINCLFDAIRYNENPIYDRLKLRLWKEEHKTSVKVFEYLLNKYPEKIFKINRKIFLDFNQITEYANLYNGAYEPDIVNALFDLMIKKDEQLTKKLLRKNIKDNKYSSS